MSDNTQDESSTDSTLGGTYHLTCSDCDYTDTVNGRVEKVFDLQEAHRDKYKQDQRDHSVEFELRG